MTDWTACLQRRCARVRTSFDCFYFSSAASSQHSGTSSISSLASRFRRSRDGISCWGRRRCSSRSCGRSPETRSRLDEIARLVDQLTRTEEGRALLPEAGSASGRR